MEADHVAPELPDPAAAGSWERLTDTLRELHRRCGRPTYEALSARVGLPKSAISYLVGRNPVRSPSESTVLRFVEGCLGFAGRDPGTVGREVERWRAAHERLSSLDRGSSPTDPAPVGSPDVAASRSGRRPSTLAVGATVALLAVVLAVVLSSTSHRPTATAGPAPASSSATLADDGPTASPAPTASGSSTSVAAGPQTGVRCVERAEPQSDARMHQEWPTVYYCPNRPAQVYTWARVDGRPIADLESRTSWFVCRAQGRDRDGRPETFYYTQGDTTWRRPELDAWGFVPGSSVGRDAQVQGVDRQCPFRAGA